jgi:cell wall-associated NlpC family hydrolase
MDYDIARQAVIQEARSWVGTPYHHAGQVKGAGVDCLTLLACVFAGAGMIEKPKIPHYPHDWHMHRSEERYLTGVADLCVEVEAPMPADIAVWKFGRCFSHGAIVVEWPIIIHAYVGRQVSIENVDQAPYLSQIGEGNGVGRARPVRFFRLRGWA